MPLELNPRQRAMLQEMGVRVWSAPAARTPPALTPPRHSAGQTPSSTPPAAFVRQSAPSVGTGAVGAWAPTGIATGKQPDWQALGQAIANCQACALSVGRRAPVWGGGLGVQQAACLVLGAPANLHEETAGHPFASEEGELLDNMLRVMGLRRRQAQSPAQAAYVSNVVKCRPSTPRLPDASELAACETHLQREIALVQPRVILTMGRLAALSLLHHQHPETLALPLGQLRGRVYRYQHSAVVVTYPPHYLLHNSHAKAGAWADLCLALDELQRP